MVDRSRVPDRSKIIVCLDSYLDGVPVGRIYNPQQGIETFQSMTQFLIKMEQMLDDAQMPQSYTDKRTFPTVTQPLPAVKPVFPIRRGAEATFEMQVIFRQHSSWQGILVWQEEQLEQSFRSVLELILLMDSALRCAGRSEVS